MKEGTNLLETKRNIGIIIVLMIYIVLVPYSQLYNINLLARIVATIFLGVGLLYGSGKLNYTYIIFVSTIIGIPSIFILMQSFFIQNVNCLSSWLARCLACFCAIYIYKSIGFRLFLNTLKWIMVVDVIGVFIWQALGIVQQSNIPGFNYLISYASVSQLVYINGNDILSNRYTAFTTNPNLFGFISACGALSLIWKMKMSYKFGWWLVFVFAAFMHQSRAAILFVLCFYFIHYSILLRGVVKKLTLMLFVLLIGILIFSVLFELRGTTEFESGRYSGSMIMMNIFLSGSISEMLFGIGYNELGKSTLGTSLFIMTDNSYIPLLVENGIVGVLFLIIPCIMFAVYVIRKNSIPLINWLPFTISFFIYSMIENAIYGIAQSYLWTIWLLYLMDYKIKKEQC